MQMRMMAWLGSMALMAGALYFQYFGGLAPCVLCIYQRVPHILVIALGWLAVWRFPALSYLMAFIMLAGAGIACFHIGVEQGWWEGLQSCGGDMTLSLDQLMDTQVARCDEIPWSFLGLSMAAWNGIISLVLAGLWVRGAKSN